MFQVTHAGMSWKTMYDWARPKISIPVHGEARQLEEHADLAYDLRCG